MRCPLGRSERNHLPEYVSVQRLTFKLHEACGRGSKRGLEFISRLYEGFAVYFDPSGI